MALFRYVNEETAKIKEHALDVNGDKAVNNKDVVYLFKNLSGDNCKLSPLPYRAVSDK